MTTVTARVVGLAARPSDLAAALTALGDAASAAGLSHSDLRLHVVACQAHHEADQLLGSTPSTSTSPPVPGGAVRDSARRVRSALARQQHTPPNIADIEWLLQLAEGVAR